MLYNNLTEFATPMKTVWLIKMCLNEICSELLIGKNVSNAFLIQNGLKQRDALVP